MEDDRSRPIFAHDRDLNSWILGSFLLPRSKNGNLDGSIFCFISQEELEFGNGSILDFSIEKNSNRRV